MTHISARYIHCIVAAAAATMLFISCGGDKNTEPIDLEQTPIQVVRNMVIIQTDKGEISMRMTAPVQQHFEYRKDSIDHSYDYYPEGLHVDAYTEDGALETTVDALEARHITTPGMEEWKAFGNVVVTNIIKQQTMESDTIYWEQDQKKIHTDCYVKIYSPQGIMQGYGMESDERASCSTILKPFDSFTVLQDSTKIVTDSANFIGPLKEK